MGICKEMCIEKVEGIMCRKKDYFKDLCKAYPLQKQLQQALEMKMKQSSDEMLQKQYQAVLKQVEQVEKIMHYMKVVHGKMAYVCVLLH